MWWWFFLNFPFCAMAPYLGDNNWEVWKNPWILGHYLFPILAFFINTWYSLVSGGKQCNQCWSQCLDNSITAIRKCLALQICKSAGTAQKAKADEIWHAAEEAGEPHLDAKHVILQVFLQQKKTTTKSDETKNNWRVNEKKIHHKRN